jgi:hypothetical protein
MEPQSLRQPSTSSSGNSRGSVKTSSPTSMERPARFRWCPMCRLDRKKLHPESGLCMRCHKETYPRKEYCRPHHSKRKIMEKLPPEWDYRIMDENGREVWASDLRERYIAETRPVGRIHKGH